MRENNAHRARIFQMIKPMQEEGEVSLACRRKLLIRSKTGVSQKPINSIVLLRVRRIHNHGIEVSRFIRWPVSVKRVTITQMLKAPRHTVKHHVHSCQVVGLILQLLTKELHGMLIVDTVLFIILDEVSNLQKQRSRTTAGS